MLGLNIFFEMLSDKSAFNHTNMLEKYGRSDFDNFIAVLENNFYKKTNLKDFSVKDIVFLPNKLDLPSQFMKSLLSSYHGNEYNRILRSAMAAEIRATLSIESVDTTFESVIKILDGGAPENDIENKVFGMKRGLEFIYDKSNKITESNLYKLYMISSGDFLNCDNQLDIEKYYRLESRYIVGNKVESNGLKCTLISQYILNLIDFLNNDDGLDQIIKAIIAQYYMCYIHPYFDGNGRVSRLLTMWYLVQNGYHSALFIPFSEYIIKSINAYYKAYEQISDNYNISGILDVTPFIEYFIENLFSKIDKRHIVHNIFDKFNKFMAEGMVTHKEKELYEFAVAKYGTKEFSTKQLEKDFGNAAYATIRAFVIKFKEHGLLDSQNYGTTRVKYKIV